MLQLAMLSMDGPLPYYVREPDISVESGLLAVLYSNCKHGVIHFQSLFPKYPATPLPM